MVLRHNIKCTACNEPHTLRVWIGHEHYQEHRFQCCNCGLDIRFAVKFDPYPENGTNVYVENCERYAKAGHIVNLNPHFPHLEAERDTEGFPWMGQSFNIIDKMEEKGVKFEGSSGGILEDLGGVPCFVEKWKYLKTLLKLSANDTLSKAKEFLAKHKLEADKVDGDEELWQFVHSFIRPGYESLFTTVAKELTPLGKNCKRELEDFIIYYWNNMRAEHLAKYIEMFDSYTEHYSEYGQLLMYAKNLVEPPSGIYATSNNFDKVKMYYGTVFEIVTGNVVVLACLNNIKNGRRFDQFKNMTLAKYNTINKANRTNPFMDNEAFTELTSNLKSSLRNASHHNAIRLKDDLQTLEYRSGDTGIWQEMQYFEYLYACNEITLVAATLLALELIFVAAAPGLIRKRKEDT